MALPKLTVKQRKLVERLDFLLQDLYYILKNASNLYAAGWNISAMKVKKQKVDETGVTAKQYQKEVDRMLAIIQKRKTQIVELQARISKEILHG